VNLLEQEHLKPILVIEKVVLNKVS